MAHLFALEHQHMNTSAAGFADAVHVFMQAIMGGAVFVEGSSGVVAVDACTFVNNTGGCLQAVFGQRYASVRFFKHDKAGNACACHVGVLQLVLRMCVN